METVKKPFIIAEIGSTHDGSFGNACNIIKVAAKCGANAVKIQTHCAEDETLPNAPSPHYFKDENRYDYFKRTEFSLEQLQSLRKLCKKLKIEFFSSPFSLKAFEVLQKLNLNYFKIASGEVTNIPLLEKINMTKKTVFLSTGMSDYSEINKAINKLQKCKIILMQCTSNYPCEIKDVGLNVLDEFKKRFNSKVFDYGFSDHTMSPVSAIGSVLKGANYIEKHITLSKEMYGSDAKFAMEPLDFKNYCNFINEAFILRKNIVEKKITPKLKKMKRIFEKSIVLDNDVKKGHVLKVSDLNFKKPGTGIKPIYYKKLIGKKILKTLKKNTLINKKHYK